MEWQFSRYFIGDTHFSDIDIYVKHASKFDLYQEGELKGTLIDYDKSAICFFRDGEHFTAGKNTSFWESYDFVLKDQNGHVLGFGYPEPDKVFFRKSHSLFFPGSDLRYKIKKTSRFRPQNGYRQIIRFISVNDDKSGCQISVKTNPGKAWVNTLFNYSAYSYDGEIRLAEGLPHEFAFAFLLLLNRMHQKENEE